MFKIKDTIKILFSIIFSSLLYVILNLIPIIGPVIVGIISGKISNVRGVKKGFIIGISSGIIGFLLILFIFHKGVYSWNIFGKILIGSFLILWNFFGIILSGIGGVIGVSLFGIERNEKQENYEEEKDKRTFILCKKCKIANLKGSKFCRNCGEKL